MPPRSYKSIRYQASRTKEIMSNWKPKKAKKYKQILPATDPALSAVCEPIDQITDDIRILANDLLWMCRKERGYGLAAPQLGALKRMIVLDKNGQRLVMINPEIIGAEGRRTSDEECLSVGRGMIVQVTRAQMVFVRYTTLESRTISKEFKGLVATIVQHEIDHLNGVCITAYGWTQSVEQLERQKKRSGIEAILPAVAIASAAGLTSKSPKEKK